MTLQTADPAVPDPRRIGPASATAAFSARADRPDVAQPAAKARLARRFRVPRSTIALLAVSIILPLLLFTAAAFENYRDVSRAAEHHVERTTRILHEHALKVFETHQLMLDQINERVRLVDWSNPAEVADLHVLLAHLQGLLPQVADIVVTDADGGIRADSLHEHVNKAINLADREYFKALKAADQPLPYVSRTIIGRQTGLPIFNMSARIKGAKDGGRDGAKDKFDGVVSVAIDPRYFGDFYRDIEREFAHLVILAREDGSVLASDPKVDMEVLPSNTLFRLALESRSKGALIHPEAFDGTMRIFGYEKVGAYPVVIGFGITWSSALAPWWRNMWGYGLVAALSSLTLLCVCGFAIRRIRMEGRATARWRATAAKLETAMDLRERAEEKLRQSQKMEAVGRLTGGIAHDFNNLLTVVIGSLDMLSRRMKNAEPRHRALVGNAIDGATRAAGLTARLLAFSRQQPLDPRPVDANALVEGMSNLLQRTLGENVAVSFDLPKGLWQTFADPNQLENAILNLCVNAVDAMPRGGTLTLATSNTTLDSAFCARHEDLDPGAYIAIAIADTGTGMAEDVMARAFEPFFTTKPIGKGTGLGLSQVYGFARQSGGHAEVESEVDRGTTIRIFLPRLAADRAAACAGPAAQPAVTEIAPAPAGAPTTILVVEDDDLVRQFSAAALRDAGYIVFEAGTGADGLRALAAHPETILIFSDMVLKGQMTGREMADRIRSIRPDLPVLFTTGYSRDAIAPMDESIAIIGKPFTAAALTTRVAEMLRVEPEDRRSAAG